MPGVKLKHLAVFGFVAILALTGCGNSTGQSNQPQPAPPSSSSNVPDDSTAASDPGLHWNPVVEKTVNDLRFYNHETGSALRESAYRFRIIAEHVNNPDFPTILTQTWVSQDGTKGVELVAQNRGDSTGVAGVAAVSIRTPANEWLYCPTKEALQDPTADAVKIVDNFANRTVPQLQSLGCVSVGQ